MILGVNIMKKLITLLIGLILIFSFPAYGNTSSSNSSQNESSVEEQKTSQSETSAAETNESDVTESELLSDLETEPEIGKTLVVYYSASGNTERVAEVIAETTGGELFELMPVEPYTDEDLDWTDDNSRVTVEYENPEQREVELVADTVEDWQDVSVVYVGYPIWWGKAAWPVDSFIKANDFTGKTVIPFCTSSSSGLGESGELLAEMAGTGEWQEGMRFQSSAPEEEVVTWVENLEL